MSRRLAPPGMINQEQVCDPPLAVLCGSGPDVRRLEEQALDGGPVVLRRANAAPLVLEFALAGQLSSCYCGVIVTFDVAAKYLKPLDPDCWSFGDRPVLVLLPGGGVDDAFRNQLLRNGASGFLPSGCDISVVHRALSAAKEGELWVTRKLLADAFRQATNHADHYHFTAREGEILHCIANGFTNQQIGETLFITRETVRWHLRSIYTKLEVHDRESLVQFIERERLGRSLRQ